jgi:hypothetical protein
MLKDLHEIFRRDLYPYHRDYSAVPPSAMFSLYPSDLTWKSPAIIPRNHRVSVSRGKYWDLTHLPQKKRRLRSEALSRLVSL